MLLSRVAALYFIALLLLVLPRSLLHAMPQENSKLPANGELITPDVPPPNCHVTLPSNGSVVSAKILRDTSVGIGAEGMVGTYGTERLSTFLPTDGVWRGWIPRKPGDFAYENKLPWRGEFSYADGPLIVTGKRLDGPAPPFTETDGVWGEHATMSFVSIPVFGCWEITGHLKEQELSFTVWVTALRGQDSSSAQTMPEPPGAHAPAHRVQVDGVTEANYLVYRLAPELPREAQLANVSGTVVLHAILKDGRPDELQYVSGPQVLAQSAIDAVAYWRYRISDNSEIDTTIEVAFPPPSDD